LLRGSNHFSRGLVVEKAWFLNPPPLFLDDPPPIHHNTAALKKPWGGPFSTPPQKCCIPPGGGGFFKKPLCKRPPFVFPKPRGGPHNLGTPNVSPKTPPKTLSSRRPFPVPNRNLPRSFPTWGLTKHPGWTPGNHGSLPKKVQI